jgi:beta-fructofuranosidase
MLDLDDDWVWDFWVVDDPVVGTASYHLFFLKAPRSLGDPELRHRNASVGHATSPDLRSWTRVADALAPQPAPAFDDLATWTGCLVRDDDGLWHLYATAHVSVGTGAAVAHAVSADLTTWEVRPPLSGPSSRFTWAEVISLVELEGRWALVFSCLSDQMPHDEPGSGGVWSVPVDGPGAPVDLSRAVRLTSEDLYVGKVVPLRDGGHRFLAFENRDGDGRFPGGVIDPCEVTWNDEGTGLRLVGDLPVRWLP